MKKNRIKRSIYGRVFGVFLAVYVLLMIGFSVFLVSQERKSVTRVIGSYSYQISNKVAEALEDNIDSNKQVTNISKVKKELIKRPINMVLLDVPEIAIFTSDYELIYNTNDYWRCSYTDYIKEDIHYPTYGLLNPYDWFSEEEVKEIESYLYANPKAKKVGDLKNYSLTFDGYLIEDEMIIPNNIYITPIYASSFDALGNVISGNGSRKDAIVYSSNYKNIDNLPYLEEGNIFQNYGKLDNENRAELRKMVVDQSKLKESLQDLLKSQILNERIYGLSYRYYMIVPYQNNITVLGENSFHSDFWTTVGIDINIGERISSTLLYVWVSCLLIFSAAAYILSRQTYKTYLKGEELERQRKEMTDALAHDLKTPLSIISGYAQNLQENINTEKREHYASHINDNVARMDKIIRKMLEMSRLESDSFELKLGEVSLGDLSNKIINRYKEIGDNKDISISLEGDTLVNADKSLIERVLDNFIINAIENTPENGRISIRISNDKFEMFNSGSHIPEDKIKDIWFPYKQANAERGNKGTGLGLSISRTILDLHKFSYGASNMEDGVIFWFKWV